VNHIDDRVGRGGEFIGVIVAESVAAEITVSVIVVMMGRGGESIGGGLGEGSALGTLILLEAAALVLDAAAESSFLGTLGASDSDAGTRHLLAIGMNPVGVPISLFTVNRWVTGDFLLSRSSTLVLLESMELNTGYPTIDAVLTTLSQLYRPEIRSLMSRRDAALRARAAKGPGTLDDTRVEVLSEVSLDIDQRIANALTDGV
jgi:hypothetical protein